MFEDTFCEILRRYPRAAEDRNLLLGLLRDYFPEQRMEVNLISTAHSLGIADEIAKAAKIDRILVSRFEKRLMDDYGINSDKAQWAVATWCVCYGEKVLGKDSEIDEGKAKADAAPTNREKPQGAAFESKPMYDHEESFEYEDTGDEGYSIVRLLPGQKFPDGTVVVPESHNGKPVTRIGSRCFEHAEDAGIREIVLPEGMRVLENEAFGHCKKLEKVWLPSTLERIGDKCFWGCTELTDVEIPEGITRIGAGAFGWTKLATIRLPSRLKEIGNECFQDCKELTDVEIPEGVIQIGKSAFWGTKLATIKLPPSLKEIGDYCFRDCEELTDVEIPEGTQIIGNKAFNGCLGLLQITLPRSVREIGEGAFLKTGPRFMIRCYPFSAAARYAQKNRIRIKRIR